MSHFPFVLPQAKRRGVFLEPSTKNTNEGVTKSAAHKAKFKAAITALLCRSVAPIAKCYIEGPTSSGVGRGMGHSCYMRTRQHMETCIIYAHQKHQIMRRT